jgi:hypothetical protein
LLVIQPAEEGLGTGSVFEGGFSFCGTISVCDLLCCVTAQSKSTNLKTTKDRNRLGTDVTVASGHCNYFYFPFL